MNTSNPVYQPSSDKQLSDHFFRTQLEGLYYFHAPKHNDERGFFSQLVIMPELEQILGKPFNIKQINHARSAQNVVRGMHAEDWNKLVAVTCGLVFSAIADIRPNSPTYKKVECFELGYDHLQKYGCGLYISQGLANSICVLQGPVSYIYLVDKLYSERTEGDNQAISLFDPELNINWPIAKEEMILSGRDLGAVELKNLK